MWKRNLAALALLGANAFSRTSEEAADQSAFKAVCGSCHSTTLVNGLRTESEWLEEVQQMVKIGARGTDQQFERVMRVLRRTLMKVNVNTAPAAEIAPVLGVTEAVAQTLVKRRTENGKFKTIDDLRKIPGLKLSELEERKDRITF